MLNHRPCGDPPLDHFIAIAQAKQSPLRERLNTLQGTVGSAYGSYAAICPALEGLSSLVLSPENAEDLLHCYNVRTEPLARLKAQIKAMQTDLQRAECQYCGIGPPKTYDHYLPKEDYPEFAVYSHNLILCCADCNHRRSTHWRNALGERVHVHLYFDFIDQSEEVLFAELDMANPPSMKFRLDLSKVGTRPFYQLLGRHFAQLDLLARYREAAPSRLIDVHRTIQVLGRGLSLSELVQMLSRYLTQELQDRGPHDWRVALLRAVRDTPEFIQFARDTPLSVWSQS
jgi:hypothetical protein